MADSKDIHQALISVVMPAYNHERFLNETIDSVLQQSWTNLELIIIDDGSKDNTGAIVSSYNDKRLHYFYQENQDAYNALNNGLAKAKGDYIAIINSDDVFTLNRLERIVTRMQAEQAAVAFSDVSPIDDDSKALDDPEFGWNTWHQKNRAFFLEQPDDLYRGFLHGNFMVTTSNLVITSEAYKKVGGFAALRYLHDYDYMFRLLLAFPEQSIYLDDEILMHYRIHGGNTLSEAAITGREQDQHVIRQYLLAQYPDADHNRLHTGINRLIALEHELVEVRAQLQPTPAPLTEKPQTTASIETTSTATLIRAIVRRLGAKLGLK